MDALVIALHLGALHPMETLAMGVLALGPFVILAVVVTIVSRRDRRAQAGERADSERADSERADSERADSERADSRGPDPRGTPAQATRDRAARWEAANSTTNDTAAPQSVQE
jgi:type VI protein secretion system component VasK